MNNHSTLEQILEMNFRTPSNGEILVPASWYVRYKRITEGEMSLFVLSNLNPENSRASIEISIGKRNDHTDSPAIAFFDYKKMLESQGFHVQGAPVVPCNSTPGFEKGAIVAFQAVRGDESFTATCMVLLTEFEFARISMTSPPESTSHQWWEFNRDSFRYIHSHIRFDGNETGSAEGVRPSDRRARENSNPNDAKAKF